MTPGHTYHIDHETRGAFEALLIREWIEKTRNGAPILSFDGRPLSFHWAKVRVSAILRGDDAREGHRRVPREGQLLDVLVPLAEWKVVDA